MCQQNALTRIVADGQFLPPKTAEEVIRFLEKELGAYRIAEEDLEPVYLQVSSMNILHGRNLLKEDLEMIVLGIPKNSFNMIYYEPLLHYGAFGADTVLTILIEKKTNYIETESPRLFSEVFLYQGISPYDIENKTLDYNLYCDKIEWYKKYYRR